jgi:acetylornithine deacetylase/succinyl-diaminopimelate desuccinylase-like protein
MALIELERRDAKLTRDVILLATPDEESGGALGAAHIVSHMPELLGGAEFLITEGGSVRTSTPEIPNIWAVAVTEKSPCWLELTARGPPGHTSAPTPDAAVPRLVAALDSVRRIETPIRVLPEVQRMFQALAPAAAPEDRAGYGDLRGALGGDRRFRRRFLANPGRNAMVRNTVSITTLVGAPRTNVAPARARAHLDVRLLPGDDCEDFAHAVANVVAEESVTVDTLLAFPSRISPIDTELYRAIERVAARDDPNSIVVPRMAAGFTDAHYFRDLGIVAYGFVPRWLSPGETRGIHGVNESVSIENLERGANTLAAIIEELASIPRHD